jgi:hypothetical protein
MRRCSAHAEAIDDPDERIVLLQHAIDNITGTFSHR